MWLSRQMKPAMPTADADLGVTTIAGEQAGVVTRGEVRALPVYGPGGYAWLPENGMAVLVIKGGPGGEEQCVTAARQSAPAGMQPGEVYLYGPGGDRERAAQDILAQVRAAGIAVRSTPIVYDPELYVLKHTKAPAVLLENGFHTNREEAALLGQADYRQKLAVAEAKGILEYLGIPWVETEEETDYQAEARAAVDWLTENGIMQGNAEGDLMLDQPLTRRQFAVLEYRIAKLEGFV